MHFFILKENLNKVLSIIARNISLRPQLPILANILFKTSDGQLKIATTNLELGIIFTVPAKIEEEGEITIPGKILSEFISTLDADKIEFILEKTKLMVRTNRTKASFTTIAASDFPSFAYDLKVSNAFSFKKIKDAILRTTFAASTDEGRPVLTGVKTVIKEGKITFAATDGYRLSIEQVDIPDKKEEKQIILPAKSLSEVVRIAQEFKAEEVGFSVVHEKNQAVFSLPNALVFTRIIDGEFPNVEKIIPDGFKTKVVIDREQFIQSVKTTSLFARGGANIIRIKIEKEGLRLKAVTPQIGENEDFVEAKIEGEETETAFNFRFLLEMLSVIQDEKLVFETSGPLNPGVFKPFSPTSSFLHIIMPVRIQE
jgi:DNA polymerase-3 subunit beta